MSPNSNILAGRDSNGLPINGKLRELLEGMTDAVHQLWKAYWARQARRATIMLLQSLDDRALADLGFKRSEIHSVVAATMPDRLRCYDSQWQEHKGA